MPASDWREAGFSDKRWLRLILIRRGEKVNARDKFILDIKDSYDGHNHSNDEIDTDTDTHSRGRPNSIIPDNITHSWEKWW